MIDDNTKYSAADYRDKLYKELQKRKKEQSSRRRAKAAGK
jgi:hypothetical protein